MAIMMGIKKYLFRETAIVPLAVVRIAFGAVLLYSTIRFLAKGWVSAFYVTPHFHFTFYGFDWMRPFPEAGMYVVFGVMVVAALFIMLGFLYRAAVLAFLLCFVYVELLDKTYYLNHYYFVSLFVFLLLLAPANRRWSLDVLLRPALRATHVPAWTIDILRLQLLIVYVFAGLSKLTSDWLFHAMPLRIWLPAQGLPIWMAYVFSWFGALFDLSIGFLLWARRTRRLAYVFVVIFHVVTALLFKIGVFPWVMMAATLVFFEWGARDKPRVSAGALGVAGAGAGPREGFGTSSLGVADMGTDAGAWKGFGAGALDVAGAGAGEQAGDGRDPARDEAEEARPEKGDKVFGDGWRTGGLTRTEKGVDERSVADVGAAASAHERDMVNVETRNVVDEGADVLSGALWTGGLTRPGQLAGVTRKELGWRMPRKRLAWRMPKVLLVLYFLLQLVLPLRFLFYPGRLLWTEQGFRFSWRVMLMEKSGTAFFYVWDGAHRGEVNNAQFLTSFQERQMATQPDMILQYAHYLSDFYGGHRVTVEDHVTLNGSGSLLFIDPEVDLSKEGENFLPKKWILPFQP